MTSSNPTERAPALAGPGSPSPGRSGGPADAGPWDSRATRHGTLYYPRADAHVGRALARYGEWAAQELALLGSVLEPGHVAVDVGAYVGTHALAFARAVGPGGRVVALEPQRLPFQTLCANLVVNGVSWVDARRAAAGAEPGELFVPEVDLGAPANFGGARLGGGGAGERVHVLALDALELPALRLLKVDAEGMELAVLRGADATVRRCAPVLYVENNDAARSRALIEHLLALDYSLYWHFSPFFSPHNFAGEREDVFGGLVDANMLCVRAALPGLLPVSGPEDTAEAALARLHEARGGAGPGPRS